MVWILLLLGVIALLLMALAVVGFTAAGVLGVFDRRRSRHHRDDVERP
jgi:hypothetical protein